MVGIQYYRRLCGVFVLWPHLGSTMFKVANNPFPAVGTAAKLFARCRTPQPRHAPTNTGHEPWTLEAEGYIIYSRALWSAT